MQVDDRRQAPSHIEATNGMPFHVAQSFVVDPLTRSAASALGYALLATVSALLSGCYLVHERPLLVDGGIDAPRTDAGVDAPRTDASCAPPLGTLVPLTMPHPHQMEATEVTRQAYGRFIACVGTPACVQRSSCTPRFDDPDAPMVCVSACEASDYCAWAGRRLCTPDEWLDACDATARQVAPDARVLDPHACVLAAFADDVWSYLPPRDGVRDVATATECHGDVPPYDRIFDLIGNASEIVEGRGTVIADGTNAASAFFEPCQGLGSTWDVDDADGLVGFRCCTD